MTRRPKQKTEPYRWGKSTGLLHQWMLRDYIRWLFPQLGAAYEPPQGVKDFTLGQQSATDGKQPEPFRPRASSGPVLLTDLHRFREYVFEALEPVASQNPMPLKTSCTLVFIPDFKRLHNHIQLLLKLHRRRLTNS
jgi:hypothetical protein